MGENWSDYRNAGNAYRNYSAPGAQEFEFEFGDDPSDFFNQSGFSDFFESFFGRGARSRRPGFQSRSNFHTPGSDIAGEIPLTLQEAHNGTKRIVDVGGEKIRVTIHPDAYDGLQLKVKGKGERGLSGRAGNLYLTLRVQEHPVFKRKGNDLYMDIPVDLFTKWLVENRKSPRSPESCN